MNIVVNEDLKAYIDPLTADEYASLEQSILAEGCRDALVLWGEVLIDGHNRYGICQKHGLPFNTVQNTRFKSMDDVHLWMIDQHLGRRSVSDFQRGVLALRRRDILLERTRSTQAPAEADAQDAGDDAAPPWDTSAASAMPPTREELARAAKLSNSQVAAIEKIQKQAAPEVIAAVRSGELSINAAAVVATLSAEEQQAAAQGGVAELKEAVKRVRESKKRPKPERVAEPAADAVAEPVEETLPQLRMRLDRLQQEVTRLKTRIAEMEEAEKPAW
ncbi:MAG: plasmid replication/partition related protein [Pseudoxanthomonas sp.]|jgi:hypothetical protein